jgi:Ca2+-binding EF-hand superfamily protein
MVKSFQYDTNNDGILDQSELAKIIKESPHTCTDIPHSVVEKVQRYREQNDHEGLSFADFYKLIATTDWIVRDVMIGYFRQIALPREGSEWKLLTS